MLGEEQQQSKYGKGGLVDSRKEISDIFKFPSFNVVYVKTGFHKKTDAKKQRIGCIHGSGILIQPLVVLTCAHNLLPPSDIYETAPEKIECYQAFHERCGYQYQTNEYKIPQLFKNNGQAKTQGNSNAANKVDNQIAKRYDFALIYLKDKGYPIQNTYPSFILDEQTFTRSYREKEQEILSFGYPSDKNRQKLALFKEIPTNNNLISCQYESRGNIINKDSPFIWYNMLAVQGQSGSPLLVRRGKELMLVGIHKGENINQLQSYGVPLWLMKQQLNEWHYQKFNINLFEQKMAR